MNSAGVLERVIERWRARLPARHTAAAVDAFVRRNREALQGLVARALARRGALPDTAEEFAAYDPVVARERRRDAEPDDRVVRRLMKRVDERIRRGTDPELRVLAVFGLDFVEARAEAILLRNVGWDAVPLLLARPAIAVVVADAVVAVRDTMGHLAIHPARRGTLNHLFFDMHRAETRTQQFREVINIPLGTRARLGRFAVALWKHARDAMPRLDPTPDPTRSSP